MSNLVGLEKPVGPICQISAVMQLRLRLGAGELHADPVVAAPADLAAIGDAVERHIKQETIGHPRLDRYFQFGAARMLVAQRHGDFRVLNPGDNGSTLEHAWTVLALGLAGMLLNWVYRIRHRSNARLVDS
ncbi:mlr0138 [Mesorhizobium japonicum MAFF 303099]|uniref:Mlr0138 protein n=1 Tax=Mesorhizobium japonicum (strain LMG 29417 / CECT 9101 / MAFF 303099) TaxID=266835 RepID=Q98NH5_RHILO|nr:mlr0138 [Mesorhizobium japonicum MAFF 303099]